jgi:hypothetical protein
MTAVDRLGFHVRVKTQDGMRGARVAFLRVVSNPAETRKVLVEMAQRARSQAGRISTSATPDRRRLRVRRWGAHVRSVIEYRGQDLPG